MDFLFPPDHSRFMNRAAVLIDGGYWEEIRKKLGRPKVDLVKFSEICCKPAARMRTYFFDGKDPQRQRLHDILEVLDRFDVELGDVMERIRHCPKCQESFVIREQKRVDVMLAVRLVHLASTNQVDLIVLVAGDRDFLPVVEVVKTAGVVIRLVCTKSTVAPGLFKAVDERIILTEEWFQSQDVLLSDTKSIPPVESPPKVSPQVELTEPTKKLLPIEEVITCLDELQQSQKVKWIRGSDLGTCLKEKKVIYNGKLRELAEFAKDQIAFKIVGTEFFLSLKDDKEESLEENGVDFLLATVTELLKESKTKSVTKQTLGVRLNTKDPDWREKYGIPKKKALTTLIQRADSFLTISGSEPKCLVGLKKTKIL